MINFKIKTVNKAIDINAFYKSTKKYCRDFLSKSNSDYIITMNGEDLKNESTNSNEGQVYVSEEISADATIYKRRRNKMASLANGSKRDKCDSFIRSCLAYIRESRIHTIDEAVYVVGRNYTGKLYVPKHSIIG